MLFMASGIALVGAAGCGPSTGGSGSVPPAASLSARTAVAPTPSTTATATLTSSASEVPTVTEPFSLSSSAFTEGGAIPKANTCDGADRSIPLAWAGSPDGAVAYALVMDDPDAGGFVHWVVYNMPAATTSLAEGASAAGDAPPQGTNSFGRIGYSGPCPPSGTHHYVVRLVALDAMLPLTGAPGASEVLGAVAGHSMAEARLSGTYRRGS